MALKLLPLVFGLILFSGLYLGGCASPIALHRAVIEYDRTVSRIETELLLLNIARARHHQPIHFTGVSSIATAFDFRVNTGITGVLAKNPSTDFLTLTWDQPLPWGLTLLDHSSPPFLVEIECWSCRC